MRRLHALDATRVDQLTETDPGSGGIIADHRQLPRATHHERVDDAFRRADAHEPPEHYARAIGDQRRRRRRRNGSLHRERSLRDVVQTCIHVDCVAGHS